MATGYWYSEALFTAVELGIFTLLEPEGKPLEEIAGILKLEPEGLRRFFQALKVLPPGQPFCRKDQGDAPGLQGLPAHRRGTAYR
nr:methyltransferase dimerization domain-containing protein [Desulfosporosinus orientis]